MNQSTLPVSDMGLATTLLYFGYRIDSLHFDVEDKKRIVLEFTDHDGGAKEVKSHFFNGTLQVEPYKWASEERFLKARLRAFKENNI